ncbi:hypothetical protein Trco_006443 [Trichoderma cornu-damae]|uniref:Uncharacterized protein n=1 Tax=Trichoderma cornu-damae TaxID=654480 RepID=A0A9P8QF78_9HYPO|nr:hypothetical protein Trco_006443 [Trichoderma cornu-damae]
MRFPPTTILEPNSRNTDRAVTIPIDRPLYEWGMISRSIMSRFSSSSTMILYSLRCLHVEPIAPAKHLERPAAVVSPAFEIAHLVHLGFALRILREDALVVDYVGNRAVGVNHLLDPWRRGAALAAASPPPSSAASSARRVYLLLGDRHHVVPVRWSVLGGSPQSLSTDHGLRRWRWILCGTLRFVVLITVVVVVVLVRSFSVVVARLFFPGLVLVVILIPLVDGSIRSHVLNVRHRLIFDN